MDVDTMKRFCAVIFEDTPQTKDCLISNLKSGIADEDFMTAYYGKPSEGEPGINFDEAPSFFAIDEALRSKGVTFVVFLDWELSKFLPALSRHEIEGLCNELGVAVCIYHYAHGEAEQIRKMKRWDETRIVLEDVSTSERLARNVKSCTLGFLEIWREFSKPDRQELSSTINRILRTPQGSEISVDQYLWSRFRPLQVAEMPSEAMSQQVITALGYWIYNVLLQFPGALLNEVAAASYLDILTEDFSREEVKRFFDRALYNGPFHETGPFWWAKRLDEILEERMDQDDKEFISGRTFLERQHVAVGRARCYRGHEGAGYYCIILQQPVCAEHSEYPSGWLPLGADRSRIEKAKFSELMPWIGL